MNKKLWDLHSVNIYGIEDLQEAKKLAKDFLGRKPGFYRTLKNSYRFRNYPKTHFNDYRTKKINDNVQLVYGVVKPEYKKYHSELKGEGIFDIASNVSKAVGTFLFGEKDFNKKSREVLDKYGGSQIVSMELYRTPIQKIATNILNLITFGKIEEQKKKFHYDQLFHVGLVCKVQTLQGLKNVIIEKNEEININTTYITNDETETKPINMKGRTDLTPIRLLECGKKIQGSKFFDYDGFRGNNCQNFLKDILTGCDLYDKDLNDWLFQPMDELVKGLPSYTPIVSKLATRFKASFNRLLGKGETKQIMNMYDLLKYDKNYQEALTKLRNE